MLLLLWLPRYTLQRVSYHIHASCGTQSHAGFGLSHSLVDDILWLDGADFPTRLFPPQGILHLPSLPFSSLTIEVTNLKPFLCYLCKYSLSVPFLLSGLQLSPICHKKISLLPSFSFINSGMSPKPLSQTDSPKNSDNENSSERQRKTLILQWN